MFSICNLKIIYRCKNKFNNSFMILNSLLKIIYRCKNKFNNNVFMFSIYNLKIIYSCKNNQGEFQGEFQGEKYGGEMDFKKYFKF